jgi:hypothetical protein
MIRRDADMKVNQNWNLHAGTAALVCAVERSSIRFRPAEIHISPKVPSQRSTQ